MIIYEFRGVSPCFVKSDFENAITNLKTIAFSSEGLKEQNLKEIDRQIKQLENKKKINCKMRLKGFWRGGLW